MSVTHCTILESAVEGSHIEVDSLVHPGPDLRAFRVQQLLLVAAVLVDQVSSGFGDDDGPVVTVH